MMSVEIILLSVVGLWLVLLIALVSHFKELNSPQTLFIAWLITPLLCLDEWLAFSGIPNSVLQGQWHYVLPLLFLLYQQVLSRMVVVNTKGRRRWYGVAVGLVFASQLPRLFFSDVPTAPIGQPLLYWMVYAPYFLNGLAMLGMAIFMTDEVQQYHNTLPEQVVDVGFFKLKGLTTVMGLNVGIAFVNVCMLIIVGLGIVNFTQWPAVFHLSVVISTLLILAAFVRVKRFSPSPLNPARMKELEAKEKVLQATLEQAEHAMIKLKAYKVIGLTLADFAKRANIDATTLAVATKKLRKRNFRAFVYHYRLEYAKKVLLRTDTKVSKVAKRLGFGSEKFLSGAFVQYMKQMQQQERR